MNNIKTTFSILDLELLSGVKAHTIRIWEKRYNILEPIRLGRNIRLYSLNDLQKMLNLSLLYNRDFKISKIAQLSPSKLLDEVQNIAKDQIKSNFAVNALIIAMYSLDEEAFEKIYQQEIAKGSFQEVYINVFVPLLHHIGLLWQSEALKPAYEHFISNLIYQKIQGNIDALPKVINKNKKPFALFLPEKEIHELGILFLNYCLKLNGHQTVYLGRSIPTSDLAFVNEQFKEITWITTFIIDQSEDLKQSFIDSISYILEDSSNNLHVISYIWSEYAKSNPNKQIIFHERFDDLLNNILD
ncbi:MAG: DNA-binding transcriptional MerR regulator [Parvicella sp.]|jgi:DNA-binding transcriptional MerR regulator